MLVNGIYTVALALMLYLAADTPISGAILALGIGIFFARKFSREVGWSLVFVMMMFFSGVINVLMLVGSFYMLQIYDRVLPSKSVETLLVISVVAAGLMAAQGFVDMLRHRILTSIGGQMNRHYSDAVYHSIIHSENHTQGIRDLDALRTFMSSMGPVALLDVPWIPMYLSIIFAFHAYLGIAVIAGAIVLIVLTMITEVVTRTSVHALNVSYTTRNSVAEACRKNREVLRAMGLINVFKKQWTAASDNYLQINQSVSERTNKIGTISKVFRMVLQSAMLGMGAWLVIKNQASGGVIIAASILTARALAPIDLAITNWKNFVTARHGWGRLRTMAGEAVQKKMFELPKPKSYLWVEDVSVKAPGKENLLIENVSFKLRAGQGLAVIGASGSGKSTLARALVHAWPATGKIKLDGAHLDQWGQELTKHIGYMPQDVELFNGTVAENISRFDADAQDADVIDAATKAGVHEMIVDLPDGYLTMIENNGNSLSAGQRQRIGLARALYKDPFLVVLDEPNANLDLLGEQALSKAVYGIRQRRGIVIVITHRNSILTVCDMMLVMQNGKMLAFDYKTAYLAQEKKDANIQHTAH